MASSYRHTTISHLFIKFITTIRSFHKSIFGIRNYQVSKHVVSVLSNVWPPSFLYTYQVIMFLHSTARSADILNPGNLAIIPQHINMVGKWSLGLMPFGLKSFGLIQMVTWLKVI